MVKFLTGLVGYAALASVTVQAQMPSARDFARHAEVYEVAL